MKNNDKNLGCEDFDPSQFPCERDEISLHEGVPSNLPTQDSQLNSCEVNLGE